MKLILSQKKWKVAENGKFIAAFDSREEAEAFMAKPEKVTRVPIEVPPDVHLGTPYEDFDGLEERG